MQLNGSDQLVYLHLFNLFNNHRWCESFTVEDAKLQSLIRLHDISGKPSSIETVRRAKQRLKAKGFIDFKRAQGKASTYNLIQLYESEKAVEAAPKKPNESQEELDENVRHAWIQANGENPHGGYLEALLTRQKRYGAKAVAEAIGRCVYRQSFGDRVSVKFLDSELLNGGEKANGKIVSITASRKSDVEPDDWEHERADSFFDT